MVVTSTEGRCYKRCCACHPARGKRRRELPVAEQYKSAPRAKVPGERECVRNDWLKTGAVDCRRPLRLGRSLKRLPLVARFTLRARRSNHKVAGSITCFALPG